jgi:hypothetical protein
VIHHLKLVLAVESSFSARITLRAFAPRWLEVALELPLYVVSLGKFVSPLL